MSFISKIRHRVINGVLAFLSDAHLLMLEKEVQIMAGKGWGGSTTKDEAFTVSRFVTELNLKEVVALDVGANLGNWSEELLKVLPHAKIVAFEPSEKAFASLLNRFVQDKRVEFVNIALGDKNCETNLFADVSASGLASLTKRRVEHFGLQFDHTERIQLRTLDSYLTDRGDSLLPNILKLDVEGHEMDVLEGAKKSLSGIRLIQFEFGGCNIDSRTFFQDFWYFFSERNFDLYRITPRGVNLIKNYSENDEIFKTTNYIAVKK